MSGQKKLQSKKHENMKNSKKHTGVIALVLKLAGAKGVAREFITVESWAENRICTHVRDEDGVDDTWNDIVESHADFERTIHDVIVNRLDFESRRPDL